MMNDWRRPGRWIDATMRDDLPSPREALRGLDARELLDALAACAEWCEVALDPQVAGMGSRMQEAVTAILRGEKDGEGRAVPLGRLLGVQPSSGATATQIVADARRNALLREARQTNPQWVVITDRRAAAAMIQAFGRYQSGAWAAVDQHLDVAPAGNALRACWWRLLKLGHTKPMLGIDRLTQILAE